MVAGAIYDQAARLRSYEILAEVGKTLGMRKDRGVSDTPPEPTQAHADQAALGAGGAVPDRADGAAWARTGCRRVSIWCGTGRCWISACSRRSPLETWELRVFGAVAEQMSWDWAGFLALPQRRETTDIHCVTTWSRFDNEWEGVATRDLLAMVQPKPEARFVVLHSYDGYTTNLPLEDFAAEDAIIAHSWQGAAACRCSMAARCGWSCRICISGRAPNGCTGSRC